MVKKTLSSRSFLALVAYRRTNQLASSCNRKEVKNRVSCSKRALYGTLLEMYHLVPRQYDAGCKFLASLQFSPSIILGTHLLLGGQVESTLRMEQAQDRTGDLQHSGSIQYANHLLQEEYAKTNMVAHYKNYKSINQPFSKMFSKFHCLNKIAPLGVTFPHHVVE